MKNLLATNKVNVDTHRRLEGLCEHDNNFLLLEAVPHREQRTDREHGVFIEVRANLLQFPLPVWFP